MFVPGRGDFNDKEWLEIRLEERKRLKNSLKINLSELKNNFWFELKITFIKIRKN